MQRNHECVTKPILRIHVFEPLILAKWGPRGYQLILSNLAPQPPPEDPQYEKA